MKKDIETKADIDILVKQFYGKVRRDTGENGIGYIFNDVVQVNWDHHIPRIVDFWEAVLFRKTQFDGNPLRKHMGVDSKEPLQQAHFDRWLELFHETVDEHFEGPMAEAAKFRSKNIASVFIQHIYSRRKDGGAAPDTFHIGSLDPQ